MMCLLVLSVNPTIYKAYHALLPHMAALLLTRGDWPLRMRS